MSPSSPERPGALVVSLDFELFWGMRDVVSLDAYRRNLEGTAAGIRSILNLFERREIHATWACVGLLFARGSADALDFAPAFRPTYRAAELSPYPMLERGEPDLEPRCYFAPEMIETIAACRHQEIGTHTFSHFYCDEPGQTAAQFDADLEAALTIARRGGLKIESLVFPRNQFNRDYLPILVRHGITSYRGSHPGWAYRRSGSKLLTTIRRGIRLADNYSLAIPDGATAFERLAATPPGEPIDIPGTRFLRPHEPRLANLESLRVHRMQSEMEWAARRGRIYHLWWHPHNFGTHLPENLVMLDNLLRQARWLDQQVGFPSLTMAELAREARS